MTTLWDQVEEPQQEDSRGEAVPAPGRLRRLWTQGGGDCLFHALKRALGADNLTHLELRDLCVGYVLQHPEEEWAGRTLGNHSEDTLAAELERAVARRRRWELGRAPTYESVFRRKGIYGTTLEAHAAGVLFDKEILIYNDIQPDEPTIVGREGAERIYLHNDTWAPHYEACVLEP